jgi:dipeptidyl aminopeptidase/acylaminoacyl peptidase
MKKKILSDHFKQFQMLSRLRREGDALYFIVKQANLEENGYDSDLYQLKDGKVNRLTSSRKVSQYTLLQGDIVFPTLREKKDQEAVQAGKSLTVWYRLKDGMGEALEWKRLPYTVLETAFLDEEHFFFTASYSNHWEKLLACCDGDDDKAQKVKKEMEEFRVFEEIPFWSNGAGDVDGVRSRLYYYNEGNVQPISGTTADVSEIRLSPEKRILTFTYEDFQGKAPVCNSLMSISVEAVKQLASVDAREREWAALMEVHDLHPKATYYRVDFISEDKAVVTLNRHGQYGMSENAAFYLWNPVEDTASMFYDGDRYTNSASESSDCRMGTVGSDLIFDKDGFVMITTDVHHTPLAHVSFDGEVRVLTRMEMVMEVQPSEDGYDVIAMVGDDGNEIYHVSQDGAFTALTDFNSHLTKEYEVMTPEPFTYTNENGLEMTGWVISPVGREPGKKYPAILDVHGGPKTIYGPHFFHEMQYWANEGFAVIFTNPTGGDGRGNAFADIRGKYGTVDYRDLMTCVDQALKQFDFIDGDRLGVTGGSYGGFMTNWIIGHTDRFKAAASQRSIASWLSFANTSDIGYYFSEDQNGTTPWEDPEAIWEHSPIKYADKVKTPTLFLHSDEDTRCWMVEGIQMFYALKNFHVPARLVLFHQETHELSRSGRPKSRIRRNEEIVKWMKKYL